MAIEVEAPVAAAGVASGSAASNANAAANAARAKNPNKVRKRAPKACLSCRARKVRCDVSQRGRPCMNCYLDSETCVVTGRASRLRKSQRPPAATAAPGAAPTNGAPASAPAGEASATAASATPVQPAAQSQTQNDGAAAQSANSVTQRPQLQSHGSHHGHNHGHNHSHSHGHSHSHSHAHTHQHGSPHSDTASRHRTASIKGSPSAARESEPPQQQQQQQQNVNEAMHNSSPMAPPEMDMEQQQSQQQHQQQQQHQSQHQSQNHHSHHNHNHNHSHHNHSHNHSHNHHQPRFNKNNNSLHEDLRSGPSNDFLGSAPGAAGMGMGGAAPWAAEQGLNISADITYSYYPFLAISNLSGILPQDVNYLELQGCLRVPTRSILDEFVQQYFLHVHPLLPLFNEGDFWELYCQQGAGSVPPHGRMSLLVFQALLFATCNFVSRTSIRALGFPTIRLARAALYRRAKLLYDFETESSPAAIAQAALLLSFWSPSTNLGTKNPNTAWLCTAIQQAKLAEANHYASFPPESRRANTLKRLWWCCIIRDRVMGLGVRRSIQITRAHFDLEANAPLTRADLADEIERSRVYNPGTKSCLIEILVHMVELCVVLTDILTLVFPQDDTPGWGRQMADSDAGRIRQCKIELRRWYKDVALKFPMFGGSGGSSDGSPNSTTGNAGPGGGVARLANGGREFYHDSVILYTNLMYMYYHSSRVALCHHEVLHIAVANAAPGFANGNKAVPVLYENRYELQDAASGVTECLKELIQLRLARWLPISAVACTALPLFLHILDVKLSTSAANNASNNNGNPVGNTPSDGSGADGNSTSASSALKQHRLNILIEAMKTYQPQYDGVDWVSETIRHIVNLAQLDGPAAPGANGGNGNNGGGNNGGNGISDWTDILASNPSWYLRLALTMDLALSKNRMPEERDFPVGLRGLFTGGFNSIRNLRLGYNKDGSRINNNNNNGNGDNGNGDNGNGDNGNGDNGNGNGNAGNNGNNGNKGNMNNDHANNGGNNQFQPANNTNMGNMAASSQTANLANSMPMDNNGNMNMHVDVSAQPQQQAQQQQQQPMASAPTPNPINMMDDPASVAAAMGGMGGMGGLPGGVPGGLGDFPGGDYSAAFMLAPHHLAMSMGMAMGMDIDMDLGDMDMDMSAFPPNALLTPGIVTQLPSSDEETSPASVSVGTASSEAANSPTAQQAAAQQRNFMAQNGQHQQQQNGGAMLDAYTFNNGNNVDTNGSPGTTATDLDDHRDNGHHNGSSKNISSKNIKADRHEAEGDQWIEPSWDDEVPEMREGDRDTARALLEAIGENA